MNVILEAMKRRSKKTEPEDRPFQVGDQVRRLDPHTHGKPHRERELPPEVYLITDFAGPKFGALQCWLISHPDDPEGLIRYAHPDDLVKA